VPSVEERNESCFEAPGVVASNITIQTDLAVKHGMRVVFEIRGIQPSVAAYRSDYCPIARFSTRNALMWQL
jgi:hypothetical protein